MTALTSSIHSPNYLSVVWMEAIPSKLELDGGAGVLFLPQRNERRLDPMPQRLRAMEAGVAGGAESNQKAWVMDAGPAMMDGEFPVRPTAPAPATIPV